MKIKILYAIQGTGNGHLARATEIVPVLKEMGETDVLLSGIQSDIKLPFTVDYRLYGLSFIFGKNGGINFFKTIVKLRPFRFIADIISLPIKNYDIILCDFEPVSAWTCRLKGKACIGISHQNAVLHPKAPKPLKKDLTGIYILNYYAPVTKKYGFHFIPFDEWNFSPIIRPDIRNAVPEDKGHYTVYLPAYRDEEIQSALSVFPNIRWEVFSKHSKHRYSKGNIDFRPVSLDDFTTSFIRCKGILCTAGFETPAEALFMGKKLCVIPMKNQYEQSCNATLLSEMGVMTLPHLKNQYHQLQQWLKEDNIIRINYPDQTKNILRAIINERKEEAALPDSPFKSFSKGNLDHQLFHRS
ncbi:MAG: glycosyltransferase family protein [Mangrovibacterium sp.]